MSLPIFIHVLSLDTVGGVEALYVHYLQDALARGGAIHYTCVSGKHPHPHFAEFLSKCSHKPFLEQYVMGMRLPKWLRVITNIRRGIVEDLVKPTSWVFWNRIEDKTPPGPSIYYEHGASWTLEPTKKRTAFLRHPKAFIANSEAASIMLQKRWNVTSPISVVPNPLRPDIALASAPRTLSSSAPLRLGFIGRLVPVKGPLIPLHVLKYFLDARIPTTLSIAGVGEEEASMKSLAKKLNISSSVAFNGCVSDVASWFDSIDILLVPSIREPLGLVSLEAAARGVPVIAANVDGLAEVVLHEKSGVLVEPKIPLEKAGSLISGFSGLPNVVVSPRLKDLVAPQVIDPKDVFHAICRFLHTPSLYEACSVHGLEVARARSSFDTYALALKSILENSHDMVE